MRARARVTVGIPVYRGAGLIEKALHSLQAQTFQSFKAVVSVDGDDQASLKRCLRHERDARFRIVLHGGQLGFAKNLNWLARECETEFFVYLAQDDRLDPTYLEQLVLAADGQPEALVVYSDMQWFGAATAVRSEPEIHGTPFERVVRQLRLCHWVALRGLRRVARMRAVAPLIADSPDNVLEDVIWFTEVMRAGTAHRVPSPLYFKRRHAASVSNTQSVWPPERARRAWLHAWAHLLRAALPAAGTPAEARRILMTVLRSVAIRADRLRWFFDLEPFGQIERLALVSDLLMSAQRMSIDLPARLGMSWPEIYRLSLRAVLRTLSGR